MTMQYSNKIDSLPIASHLDSICEALKKSESRFLVLTAETAAGKSTALPLALLKHFDGKILMLEPRRLAVTAIADRVSELLEEETGKTAGYTLHLEKKISKDTRLEVITEAILTRKLQNDMELNGVSVVVIDEYHERSIHADLALAFLKESMQLRDDLFVVVMSATIDTKPLCEYLGTKESPAPVYHVQGRQFSVEKEYWGNISVSQAIKKELSKSNQTGSILVFLPGISDIRRVERELDDATDDAQIMILHSSITLEQQKKILNTPKPDEKRRVILSSAIAETSITVPDVDTVIDSGLCRLNRLNVSTAMEHLVTESESEFSAAQRAGRAGRVKNGRCICLWNENEPRIKSTPPQIMRSDLSSLVLECALWGVKNPSELSWFSAPPLSAWKESQKLLQRLGCIDKDANITQTGKNVLKLGESPRISCIALMGKALNKLDEAFSLIMEFSSYKDSSPKMKSLYIDNLKRRLSNIEDDKNMIGKNLPSLLIAGFPDRIAQKQEEEKGSADNYKFPSGRQAFIQGRGSKYIVAVDIDAGESQGKIYSYKELDEKLCESWLLQNSESNVTANFIGDTHKLAKYEIVSYGKIVLSKKKLDVSEKDFAIAVCNAVEQNGLEWLALSDISKNLLLRAKFLTQTQIKQAQQIKEKLESITENTSQWLLPFINSASDLNANTVFNALSYYLDSKLIDSNAPTEYVLPNGKKRKIIYENQGSAGIVPTLEVIIQHIFGCMTNPQIAGKPILLKLLSPARRPLQITSDLAGFWNNSWIEICKEMKGRYPKHNWDYRIIEKE